MTPHFAARFEEKGYVLLGWVPVGWVHFFSKKEITSIGDLNGTKAWMWEGDPLVQDMYKRLEVNPHPLSVTDVLLSLQTGMIDTVYASPVGALALQWFTKVHAMSALRMANATGAVLMTERQFKKLSPAEQKAVREVSQKNLKTLVEHIQADNDKAIEVMKQNGLKMAPLPAGAELDRFHEVGKAVQKDLVGKLYDQKLLDQVLNHLKSIRN